MKDQLKEARQSTTVEMQCEMATRAYDLIVGKIIKCTLLSLGGEVT
jgi:hypothetical protein